MFLHNQLPTIVLVPHLGPIQAFQVTVLLSVVEILVMDILMTLRLDSIFGIWAPDTQQYLRVPTAGLLWGQLFLVHPQIII